MKRIPIVWLVLVQWVIAYQWLHSAAGKWFSSAFITNIGATLEGFATKTPYAWYGALLDSSVLPNATLFGNVIRSGELLIGAALLLSGILLLVLPRIPRAVSILVIIACLGGALMNLNFYLAAGWASPSTAGINVMMGMLHIILAAFYVSLSMRVPQGTQE